ncbi:MAG: hypothetical protein RSD29_01890 [Bacilli bacterium]
MKSWETFENNIASYLSDMLRDYDLEIKQLGNSDSTTPDIEITLNNKESSFFIETKMPLSQTSQFVVEIKNNKFNYGENNNFKSNIFSNEIIKVLK